MFWLQSVKVHCCFEYYESPPLDTVFSQFHPHEILTTYLLQIRLNVIFYRLGPWNDSELQP
jgi:hypothetical protein